MRYSTQRNLLFYVDIVSDFPIHNYVDFDCKIVCLIPVEEKSAIW